LQVSALQVSALQVSALQVSALQVSALSVFFSTKPSRVLVYDFRQFFLSHEFPLPKYYFIPNNLSS
jgi:hypothetical protein